MKNKSEREVTGMIDFKNSEYVKMKEIDPGSIFAEVQPLLIIIGKLLDRKFSSSDFISRAMSEGSMERPFSGFLLDKWRADSSAIDSV